MHEWFYLLVQWYCVKSSVTKCSSYSQVLPIAKETFSIAGLLAVGISILSNYKFVYYFLRVSVCASPQIYSLSEWKNKKKNIFNMKAFSICKLIKIFLIPSFESLFE